jgi:hypothetical protein
MHREVERVRIVRPLMYRPQGFGLHEFDAQAIGEPRHDLVLHFEQIDDRLVEPLGPDVRAGFGFDELYEGAMAFMLEAGFLGIMMFGWDKVPRPVHLLATAMVAAGASLSAFWIVDANSWMQTPAGGRRAFRPRQLSRCNSSTPTCRGASRICGLPASRRACSSSAESARGTF